MEKFEERAGYIILTPDEGEPLELPLYWWLTQESGYVPVDRREYISEERHSIWRGPDQGGGAFPWPDGERYIQSIEQYRTDWAAHLAATTNPEPEPEPQPDWVSFRREMFQDPDYAAIGRSYWQATRVENAITADSPDLPSLKTLWNQLILVLLEPPTQAAIEEWQRLADLHAIPLTFSAEGRV